jgi:Kef-type K+ transport system membrane component KefB
MGEAIGQVLPLAVGVALSPMPIVAVVLMLVTRQARVNGPVFVLGWLVGLAVVGVIVLALAGPADASEDGEPATWVGVAAPVVLCFALGDRAPQLLEALRSWMARNSAVIMAVLLLVLGTKLVGQGIAAL